MELTAYNPEAREDPHSKLKELREFTPAMRDEMAKVWMIGRYDDVRGLINDPAMLRSPHAAEAGSVSRRFAQMNGGDGPQSILFLDDPEIELAREKIVWRRLPFFRGIEELMLHVS